jgi:hypothetical protein
MQRSKVRSRLQAQLRKFTCELSGGGRRLRAGADMVADQSVRSARLAIARVDRTNSSEAVEN